MSSSKLRDYVREGATYYHAVHVSQTHHPIPTEAMRFGAMVHDVVLSPPWSKPIKLIPDEVLAKNGAKSTKAWDAFSNEFGTSHHLMKRDKFSQMNGLIQSIRGHDLAHQLIFANGVKTERAIYSGGIFPKRARLDAVSEHGIADLKVHDDLDPQHLCMHTVRMRYDWQLAFYQSLAAPLLGKVPCYLVYVRSVPPYQTRVIKLSQSWLDEARGEFEQPLRELYMRHAKNEWREPDHGAAVEFERPRAADYRDEYRMEHEEMEAV